MPEQPPIADSKGTPELPDNLSDCHEIIRELYARVEELEKQVSRRNRMLFGQKSAKVDSALLTGTGKAVHTQTIEELECEKSRLNIVQEKATGGGRVTTSDKLSTREEKYFLDENQLPCPCCGKPREIFGFDISYQIEFVKLLFENIQHTMFKYACKTCEGGHIITAHKPYQPIDKGKAGPGLLAKIATDKFWLHLPLYRQEQVFAALSIPVGRSAMCRWLAEIAKLVAPIVKRMRQLILQSRVVQSDATRLPVLKKGLGKAHKGFVWVYRGDAKYPYVFYDYSDTEHSGYPTTILNGFQGILQTDGTNKYNEIIRNGATAAACWAHVHCDFEDAWKHDPKAAEFPMGVIKSLFDIERAAKGLSESERQDLRQRLAKPKLDSLKQWLDEQNEFQLPKGRLGEAISYALNHWNALVVYIDHPFVEISNNASERNMKPLVIGRKNWLFSGSEEGGHNAAIIMSLIETCKRLDINPFDYLKDVLTRFPSAKTSQIDDFLPDRWLALRRAQS
jgi:transposase